MKLTEMMNAITSFEEELDNDSFSLGEIEKLSYCIGELERSFRSARLRASRASDRKIAESEDEVCLPGGHWEGYSDHGELSLACEALDAAALPVIRAIREEKSYEDISKLLRKVTKTQWKWSHTGVSDSEGRDAIFRMISRSCKGTRFDPEEVWDNCYS